MAHPDLFFFIASEKNDQRPCHREAEGKPYRGQDDLHPDGELQHAPCGSIVLLIVQQGDHRHRDPDKRTLENGINQYDQGTDGEAAHRVGSHGRRADVECQEKAERHPGYRVSFRIAFPKDAKEDAAYLFSVPGELSMRHIGDNPRQRYQGTGKVSGDTRQGRAL